VSPWNNVDDCLPGTEQAVLVIVDGEPVVSHLTQGPNGDLEWVVSGLHYTGLVHKRIQWWMPIPEWRGK
jgi:hypothetical protein